MNRKVSRFQMLNHGLNAYDVDLYEANEAIKFVSRLGTEEPDKLPDHVTLSQLRIIKTNTGRVNREVTALIKLVERHGIDWHWDPSTGDS